MKIMVVTLLAVSIFNLGFLATPVCQAGVLNGGGGNILPENRINFSDLSDLIISSRAELILFFNAQKGKSVSAEFTKLFSGSKSIFDVIRSNAIYVAGMSSLPCKDENGNNVDGSAISPKPDSICISMGRLQEQLTLGTARVQVLALIAHEYSHLIGLNEVEAESLQRQISSLLEFDSKDHIYKNLSETKNGFQKIRGAIINDENYTIEPKNWNYYCFMAFKLHGYFVEVLGSRSLKEFSFFDDLGRKRFKAYFQKSHALLSGTCAQSDYHPQRKEMAARYKQIFGNQTSISAQYYSNYFNDWIVDPRINFIKISQLADVKTEVMDIRNYVEIEFERIWEIYKLYDEYYLY